MNKTIGTCSICGGKVSVPTIWFGTVPSIPTCESCGATKKQPHGPVIEMERKRKTNLYNHTIKDLSSTIKLNDHWDD